MAASQHRPCLRCGKALLARWQTKFCSHACYGASKAGRREETKAKYQRTCERCGTGFITRYPGGYNLKKGFASGRFCSRACYHGQRSDNRTLELRRARKRLVFLLARRIECQMCGVICHSVNRSKFCSRQCAYKHDRLIASSVAKLPCVCKECEKEFTPAYGVKLRVFCSSACRKRYTRRASKMVRKAVMKGCVSVERIDPILVFNRDGWKCHICKRATPKRLRGTFDERAPELDHILPLSMGGSHTWDNVACACRRCNGEKSNKPKGQMLLFPEPRAAA